MLCYRYYERTALGILTECYNQDMSSSYDLLIRKHDTPFDSKTPLEMADENYLKEFMGHQCCQTKLNIIWRGKISVHTPWWKVFVSLYQYLISLE
jgi:hypothetical protein